VYDRLWPRAGTVLFGLIMLVASPCLAQVRGEVCPAQGESSTFGTLTVGIEVDLGTTGKLLGSYGASLAWNPAVLQYQSDTGGGQAPFDTAVVNRDDVATGLLRFSDASPTGAGGRVNIFNVMFQVIAEPFVVTVIDLEFSSMFAAETFEDLQPILQIQDGTTSVTGFFFDLRPVDGEGKFFEWNVIPGAVDYDVIRGNLGDLFDDGATVRLGSVKCVEADSTDTTTAGGTDPPNPDNKKPHLGTGFFYLARFNDGLGDKTYGFTRDGHERVVDAGDCP